MHTRLSSTRTGDIDNWQLPSGRENAQLLRAEYAAGFEAIAEYDRVGHLLLHRAGQAYDGSGMEQVVGLAVLRRAVALFSAVRTLLQSSQSDSARALARAYFELLLQHRCLAYGARTHLSLESTTTPAEREPRATRYYVAAQRRNLRSRALVLKAGSPYPPSSVASGDALRRELAQEISRLRSEFPEEWTYFGDVTEETVVKRISGRDEPPWYSAEFAGSKVNSIGRLAEAFGYGWEYDFIYDAFSALVHSRGVLQDLTVEGNRFHVNHPSDTRWFELVAYWVVHWHATVLITAAKWHSPETIPALQQLGLKQRIGLESLRPKDLPSLLA